MFGRKSTPESTGFGIKKILDDITKPGLHDLDATHKMTGKHYKIGTTVYPDMSSGLGFLDAMGWMEEVTMEVDWRHIYGVITEINKRDGTYVVKWLNDKTGAESETGFKCAWFCDSELTTNREKFLKQYTAIVPEIKKIIKGGI